MINQTIIDVAFNLTGSLTGYPAILNQLEKGVRLGFEDAPYSWEDVDDPTKKGQTWTPSMDNVDQSSLIVQTYNAQAMLKSPFTTNLYDLEKAIEFGQNALAEMSAVPILGTEEIDEVLATEDVEGLEIEGNNSNFIIQ